jgi:hypothetical protein
MRSRPRQDRIADTAPPPAAEPLVRPGEVVHLAPGDRKWNDEPITLRVKRVQESLSALYAGDWVWLHGDALDGDGRWLGRVRVLARVAALRDRRSET